MQAILARRKSTLKHINTIFHDNFPFPRLADSYHDMMSHFGSFDKFKALEKLLVPVPCFRPGEDFTDLLPESLSLLGLRRVPERWDGVWKLANAVRSGRFSQLKKVVLDLGGAEFETARAQLNIAGVTCVRYDNSAQYPFGQDLPCKYICHVI